MTWTTLPRSELAPGLSGWRAGSGPDLVLIHGVGLRAEAWGALIPLLTPHARLHVIDMPGHGTSAPPDAPGLDGFTPPIANYINQLPGPAGVVGHSMGAMIALDLAAKLPDRIIHVAALNAIFERSAPATAAVKARAQSLSSTAPGDPGATLTRWFGPDHNTDMARACADWLTSCDPASYKAAYTVFATHPGPSRTQLANLTCPALFLTGADEPNSTPQMTHQMADLAPNATAIILENAAHMAPMTHAAAIAPHLIAQVPA
ncbi:MAG: alpha/beta fold hydrolase [Sedimentitalea sp.]